MRKLREKDSAEVEVLLGKDIATLVLDRLDEDKPETVRKLREERKEKEV